MLNEFVEKILVHALKKIDGDRVQEVEIYLNFIGHFEALALELTPEEEKRQEYLRKHRLQSRERYKALKAGTRKVGEAFQMVCKCCGKTFESKMSNAMFCNQNCRAKFYRQEKSKKKSCSSSTDWKKYRRGMGSRDGRSEHDVSFRKV